VPNYFFDTSAVVKHYHPEIGTPRVNALLAVAGGKFLISRLSVVEMTAALTKKVRVGQISATDCQRIARQFRRDQSSRWRVARVLVAHFEAADRLIQRIGLSMALRSLDSIQLADALAMKASRGSVEFVCSDQALCTIAAAEGLTVINPEAP
jgi:uncharacterized protein